MKTIFTLLFAGIALFGTAQNYVHQALILNEGYYDYGASEIIEPVTIASYNPTTETYTVVATLDGMRFGSDMIISGDYYYVAADTRIFKFDLNTHALIGSVECVGVRNLAIAQGKLVATRGEYLTTFDSYLHVYDANDLSLIQAIDVANGPQWATQNIVIDGDKAYIAVNNGYDWGNEKGIIGILDMNTLTYGNEIDLGVDGKNPDNLVKSGGYLYSVNNKDWSGSSVSKIALNDLTTNTLNIASASTGCGTSALREDKLVYQISSEVVLNEFDITMMNNNGPVVGFDLNYYELAEDTINNYLYASSTDFFSFGEVRVYDALNAVVTTFDAGVSPGTIVFDVRSSLGLIENVQLMHVYPNPMTDNLTISTSEAGTVVLTDLVGKVVFSATTEGFYTMNVSGLPNGNYFVSFTNEANSTSVQKVTKQ